MAIQRTQWQDDDGTGTTGTVINNAEKQLLYDQIDAVLAGYLPLVGGFLTGNLIVLDTTTYSLMGTGANGLGLAATHGAGAIRFYSGGSTLRWMLHADGGVSTDDVSPGAPGRLRVTSTDSISVPNMGTNTGTVIIRAANGFLYQQTSSARYKEHLDPWDVSPATLAQFVARSPRRWEYTGQATGAAGFIAEDLTDLVPNADGRSALLNYDADGRPESNRDFAIIGLQHLVIQDLWRRVAALEGRL